MIKSEHSRVNLGGMYEVHLKQASLQVSFGRTVVLQSVQQEGRALLDQISLHEHVNNLAKSTRGKLRKKYFPFPPLLGN